MLSEAIKTGILNELVEYQQKDTPVSAVYFLLEQEEVVYVGATIDICRRIGTHLSQGTKFFNDIAVKPTDEKDLSFVEIEYIREHKPKYNKLHNEDSIINSGIGEGNLFASYSVWEHFKNTIGIPKPTLANWSKEKDTWRAKLYRKLEKDMAQDLANKAKEL